jgi:hypothetical protein
MGCLVMTVEELIKQLNLAHPNSEVTIILEEDPTDDYESGDVLKIIGTGFNPRTNTHAIHVRHV